MKKSTLIGAKAALGRIARNQVYREQASARLSFRKRYAATVGIEEILVSLRKKVLLLQQTRENRAVMAALHRAYPFADSNYRGGNPQRPHFQGLPSGRHALPLDFSLEREIRYAAPPTKNAFGQHVTKRRPNIASSERASRKISTKRTRQSLRKRA